MYGKVFLRDLLNQLIPICEDWIKEIDGQTFFVDPIDGEEISAHYGATHMAAAMILFGNMEKRQSLSEKGQKLLNSILSRWNQSKLLPTFHNDFNNFALCVLDEMADDNNVAKRIWQVVLNTGDSDHNTINWLPMRWYVNMKRYQWTRDYKYLNKCKIFKNQIEKATNADGGIEDRLPKGLSFNLQYDVATVGVLQFLRNRGIDYDLSRELRFLLNAVAPDGDINYQGRGTNQIFAWGLWVYLLATSNNEIQLDIALRFLKNKITRMFQHGNLMLNEWDGAEKYLWWDYHYCSVYCAHFLFWLVLSLCDFNKRKIVTSSKIVIRDTGLQIYRTNDVFVSLFSGRKEYLSEKGPVVCALWMRKYGVIFKGSFGPWQGAFGNKYSNRIVLLNFCGLLVSKYPSFFFNSKWMIRIRRKLGMEVDANVKPVFVPIEIQNDHHSSTIRFKVEKRGRYVLNVPILDSIMHNYSVIVDVDGCESRLIHIAKIKNQYGWISILQTPPLEGKVWTLSIL